MQPRDRRLLSALEVLRIIDRSHAERLGPFDSLQRANARLLQLTRAGIVRRDSWGTINGGRKNIYRLPGRRFKRGMSVEHELMIADCYVGFSVAAPGPVSMRRWTRPDQPLAGVVVPDGFAHLDINGRVLPLLIEVDRGTETLGIIRRKVESYLALALSGDTERLLGARQFRVAVVTTSNRRLESLAGAIAARTDKIFWLTTHDALRRSGPWAPIWRRAAPGDQPPSVIASEPYPNRTP
jgi:hypothetical protein